MFHTEVVVPHLWDRGKVARGACFPKVTLIRLIERRPPSNIYIYIYNTAAPRPAPPLFIFAHLWLRSNHSRPNPLPVLQLLASARLHKGLPGITMLDKKAMVFI